MGSRSCPLPQPPAPLSPPGACPALLPTSDQPQWLTRTCLASLHFLDSEDKTEREAWGEPSWRPRGSRGEGPRRTRHHPPPSPAQAGPRAEVTDALRSPCGSGPGAQAVGCGKRDNRRADSQNFEGFVTKGDSTKPEITGCHGPGPRSWAGGGLARKPLLSGQGGRAGHF